MNCDRATRVIDAGLDGELDAATDAELLRHVSACPACASLRDERQALRHGLRSLPRQRAPERLRLAIVEQLRQLDRPAAIARRPSWRMTMALASLAASFAFVAGWWIAAPMQPPDVREEAIARHVASLASGARRDDVTSGDRHVVRPWFSGRIDFAPPVRDLSNAGFALVGGRLDSVAARPTAVIHYRIRAHDISLFVARSRTTQPEQPSLSTPRGFTVVAWAEDGLALTAISDVSPEELTRFVASIRGP